MPGFREAPAAPAAIIAGVRAVVVFSAALNDAPTDPRR
jgi:hypothetical protein